MSMLQFYFLHMFTRSEMHQMLEEMSHHIQQQSDSHSYLEKLRRENERMTLKEKERQVLLSLTYL